MDMIVLVILGGLLVGLTAMMHSFKLGVRKILGYDVVYDIITSVALYEVFQGTQLGLLIAVAGGGVITVGQYVIKQFTGFKRLKTIIRTKDTIKVFGKSVVTVSYPQVVWVDYPPRFGKDSRLGPYGVALPHPYEIEEMAKAQRRLKRVSIKHNPLGTIIPWT